MNKTTFFLSILALIIAIISLATTIRFTSDYLETKRILFIHSHKEFEQIYHILEGLKQGKK